MPLSPRKTAVLRFVFPHRRESEILPLDSSRRYDVAATIDRETIEAAQFASPFGDEEWRDIVWSLRQCTSERGATGDGSDDSGARRRNRRRAEEVEEAGRKLYRALAALAPELRAFLEEQGPRRLVIESKRPEIHALPWETLNNDRREHVAEHDLSIVRCQNAFHHTPQPSPSFLYALATSGPDTPAHLLDAVKSVGISEDGNRRTGIAIVEEDRPDAQLVHLVAHGSQYDASVLAARNLELLPAQLAETFHERLMVLLWSCYSANVLSTGESVAMALQRAGNQFVLGFVAPLHFVTAAQIATSFYEQVFGVRGHQDPETAVTRIRQAHRAKSFEFCDWASMTLWLDRPVDLSRLPLGRVRLPSSDWSDRSLDAIAAPVRAEFEKAALGEARLISRATIAKPLPLALARQWSGPVVHLDGPLALRDDGIFAALGLNPRRDVHPHDADLFLHLLDHLATYRFALIVWSGVGSAQALLVETLERVPANVGLVLLSQGDFPDPWLGRAAGESGVATTPVPTGRNGFLYLVKHERFDAALELARDTHYDDAEYWNGRYFAAIKTNRRQMAEEAIAKLKTIDPIEANLLQGNLHVRNGDQVSAFDSYQLAADAALAAKRWRDFARVRLEMSYLFEERGDRGLAVQLYGAAIELLNETPLDERNSLWSSALGRALRDYAHLLAKDGNTEALPLVRRATAIHAFEGRRTQAAYCLVTRSELACNTGRYDDAERYARQAATVFDAAGNRDGWLDAVRLLARSASARNLHDRAIAILRRAASWPLKPGAIGLLFFDLADVYWAAGNVEEAAAHARGAAALLARRRRPLAAAQRLIAATRALQPPSAPLRVATLAGRMLDNSTTTASAQVLEDLRVRLCRCFVEERTELLVSSAARGADLIALDVARQMGIRCRIVLPFAIDTFRKTSVEKPDTNWNDLYQQSIDDARTRKDLVVVDAGTTYKDANTRILEEAEAEAATIANGGRPLAIVVWEGRARDDQDTTSGFKRAAEARGMDVREILIG